MSPRVSHCNRICRILIFLFLHYQCPCVAVVEETQKSYWYYCKDKIVSSHQPACMRILEVCVLLSHKSPFPPENHSYKALCARIPKWGVGVGRCICCVSCCQNSDRTWNDMKQFLNSHHFIQILSKSFHISACESGVMDDSRLLSVAPRPNICCHWIINYHNLTTVSILKTVGNYWKSVTLNEDDFFDAPRSDLFLVLWCNLGPVQTWL